ncbi:MAG: Eco57I restriction-modification methylase domain-containing protein [Treponema sp.]
MSIKSKEMTFEERLARLKKLIYQFKEGEAFYTSKDFVESEVRSKFIDPFLECLKWDVKNEKGARYDKREVITEDRIVVDGQTKHPDYTLCCAGVKKIFVEAKKPSVNLKLDPAPALQVRRYAYTAQMPIAILTDFQELAIYDTRIKPTDKDTASTARIEYLTYDKYEEKFEELYNHISWDAVDLGKFDTYYESAKEKRGTASVDEDILEMIERWRVLLAEDIALHNEEMNETALTNCVQKLIDRILFLRITEDKEIEPSKQLQRIITKNKLTEIENNSLYATLKVLFRIAESRFNAGLFTNDDYLNSLKVQDKTLCTIINELYYPICQYEFSVLPVEILGNVYERFLGKIIHFKRKTKNGHSVEIIEKPEVQKAGGVYYTPSYIVNYIVKETIGKKIEMLTPEKVSKLKVCDPSCGSGSFLVGAYQYLLEWHLDYYYNEERRVVSEKKGLIYKDDKTREYKLSIEEKRRILLNNIYGVDIDGQAVEVTKLSLFLKLLENEGKALSTTGQASLFKTSDITKILPSLTQNIKCGNSLIGSDYYKEKNLSLLGIEEQRKVNAFDWKQEFPNIFKQGGFDCVIGNPPYVLCQPSTTEKSILDYYAKYKVASYKIDLFHLFFEKAINLLKNAGMLGFITPNTYLTNRYINPLRQYILSSCDIMKVAIHEEVFKSASVDVATIILKKDKTKEHSVIIEKKNQIDHTFRHYTTIQQSLWEKDKGFVFNINKTKEINLSNTVKLASIFNTYFGIQAFDRSSSISFERKDETYLPIIDGEDILPYMYAKPKKFFHYKKENIKSGGDWNVYNIDRIVVRQIGKLPVVGLSKAGVLASNTLYSLWPKTGDFSLCYILSILNSRLIKHLWKTSYSDNKELFPKIKGYQLKDLPIKSISLEEQEPFIQLSKEMIEAHKELEKTKFEEDKKFLKQRIDILDSQINSIVYKLYNLNEKEIKIVEE